MATGERIKRGLYRLGEATTAQLATFSGQTREEVEEFLAPRGYLFGDAGGPRYLWRLSTRGREALREELALDGMDDTSIEDLQRCLSSLETVEADLDGLAAGLPISEFDEAMGLLDIRIKATRKAMLSLQRRGIPITDAFRRLNEASERLGSLQHSRGTPDDVDPVLNIESAVATYLSTWADQWPGHDKYVPTYADAGPMVIVDGTRHADYFVRSCIVAASSARSPVIAMQVKDPTSAAAAIEFEQLEWLLSEAAGAAVRIVVVVDGRDMSSHALADRCLALDRPRFGPAHTAPPAPQRALAGPVVRAADNLRRRVGGMKAFADVLENQVSSVARRVAVTALMDNGFEPGPRMGSRLWERSDPTIVCIDLAADGALEPIFRDSDVVYTALTDLDSMAFRGIRPLFGAYHRAIAGHESAWILVKEHAWPLIDEKARPSQALVPYNPDTDVRRSDGEDVPNDQNSEPA